jgi:hypothetical protein
LSASGAVGSAALADDIGRLEKEVIEGASLSEALKRSTVLPAAVGFVAGIGEESGDLNEVLRDVADSYNDEVDVDALLLRGLTDQRDLALLRLVAVSVVEEVLEDRGGHEGEAHGHVCGDRLASVNDGHHQVPLPRVLLNLFLRVGDRSSREGGSHREREGTDEGRQRNQEMRANESHGRER